MWWKMVAPIKPAATAIVLSPASDGVAAVVRSAPQIPSVTIAAFITMLPFLFLVAGYDAGDRKDIQFGTKKVTPVQSRESGIQIQGAGGADGAC